MKLTTGKTDKITLFLALIGLFYILSRMAGLISIVIKALLEQL